jgi:hypothetical protein
LSWFFPDTGRPPDPSVRRGGLGLSGHAMPAKDRRAGETGSHARLKDQKDGAKLCVHAMNVKPTPQLRRARISVPSSAATGPADRFTGA